MFQLGKESQTVILTEAMGSERTRISLRSILVDQRKQDSVNDRSILIEEGVQSSWIHHNEKCPFTSISTLQCHSLLDRLNLPNKRRPQCILIILYWATISILKQVPLQLQQGWNHGDTRICSLRHIYLITSSIINNCIKGSGSCLDYGYFTRRDFCKPDYFYIIIGIVVRWIQ